VSLPNFAEICIRLSKQRHAGAQYSIFLGDFFANPEYLRKYANSFAGNVVHLQITAMQSALIMFCARVWDPASDVLSIPNAVSHIKKIENYDDENLLGSLPAVASCDLKRVRGLVHRTLLRFAALHTHETRRVVRVIRSEELAHLSEVSRDRSKLFPAGDFEQHTQTWNSVVEFARESVRLVDDLVWLGTGDVFSFDINRTTFEGYCRSFWTHMPVYGDCE
jgi:hypothetical protein